MTTTTIWISYDLGVRGDYDSLYSWLDDHRAKECGDSLAVVKYEYEGNLPDAIRADLQGRIETDKKTRIYIIYREPSTNKNKGKFIFGDRRAAPWTGFAPSTSAAADEEE